MSPPPRVLVADHPESFAVFRSALTAPFTLEPAATVDEAKAVLAVRPALVVCGCHFDEGRMYDLLRYMKASDGLRQVPFMAVRCVEGELLDDSLYESVKTAVRALGGDAFVDLPRWQRRGGAAQASHRLSELVQALAGAAAGGTA